MALAVPTHLKSMSRITQFTNPLGVFNQTYDPVNLMLGFKTEVHC
jgi:hypothetical protein